MSAKVNRVAGVMLCLAALPLTTLAQDAVMVVAHGAPRGPWNERVRRIVEKVEWAGPVGAAFLMPARPDESLEAVAVRLDQSNVRRIVIVPLMVSSHSEHAEELKFIAGLTKQPPHHEGPEAVKPLITKAQLVLAPAMDADALITRILGEQVRAISQDAMAESLVLVGHGPNDEAMNRTWLSNLEVHAARLRKEFGFRTVEAVTLRDDAPKPIRDDATRKLQEVVKRHSSGSTALVLPVLVSVGKIQREIRERLEGLAYRMNDGGIAEHALAAQWIQQQARQALRKVASQNARD